MEIWKFLDGQVPQSLAELPTNLEGCLWVIAEPRELDQVLAGVTEAGQVEIHPEHLEDCRNPNHPVFFDQFKNYDFLILRSVVAAADPSELVTTPVVFFRFPHMIITICENQEVMTLVKARLEKTGLPQTADTQMVLYRIVDELVDQFLHLRERLTEEVQVWQGTIFAKYKPFREWKTVFLLKNTLQRLIALSEAQVEVVNQWQKSCVPEAAKNLSVQFRDLINHIDRILYFSRQLEMQLNSLIQLYFLISGGRTNQIILVLALISGTFLPLSLIAGIFGMNFHDIPFVSDPNGFYFCLLVMLGIALTAVIFFRWKRWL